MEGWGLGTGGCHILKIHEKKPSTILVSRIHAQTKHEMQMFSLKMQNFTFQSKQIYIN